MLITCIDDRKSEFLELNKTYIASEDNTCYIIDFDENNIKKPDSCYRRPYFKISKKYFIKHKNYCLL